MVANSGQDMSGFAKTECRVTRSSLEEKFILFPLNPASFAQRDSNGFCTIDFSLHPASELPGDEVQLGVGRHDSSSSSPCALPEGPAEIAFLAGRL